MSEFFWKRDIACALILEIELFWLNTAGFNYDTIYITVLSPESLQNKAFDS